MLRDRELRAALAGTALEQYTLTRSRADVWLLEDVDPAHLLPVWRAARELLPVTGRWPVAVLDDAFYYAEPEDPRRAAEQLAEAAGAIDPATVFPAWVDDLPETAEDLADFVAHRFPRHPELADRMVRELGDPTTEPAWDAWLYEELLRDPELRAEVDVAYLIGTRRWHSPPAMSLALLPDARGWLAPAFLGFHSCEHGEPAAALAAVQRRWEQDYGAELVAHYGTMLQYTVDRPPTDSRDAFRLACEHKDVAGSLQMYRYELALALPHSDAWFLHDRP